MKCLILAVPLVLFALPLRAEVFNTVNFPAGSESFADLLIRFDPEFSGGTATVDPHPYVTVGVPNFTWQSLGDGGLIELLFVDNALTNSRNSSPDLYIGEGDGTAEDFFVSLRPTAETKALLNPADDTNGDGYYEIGNFVGARRTGAAGFVRTIDIDQAFPLQRHLQLAFDAIQIVDDPDRGEETGLTVGLDLESVGAISSVATGEILQIGDTDDDDDVDLEDLNNVRNHFGGHGLGDTWPFDGVVNLADLNAVRNNFGAGAAEPAAEPSSLVLLSLGAAGIVARWQAARR